MPDLAESRTFNLFQKNLDLILVVAVLGTLLAIVMPLSPFLLDFLLIINISLAIIILFTSIYVSEPLGFSVFPTMLLMTTFYRLALNIASTRLILGNVEPKEPPMFAGKVLYAFGAFVGANSPVVGFIIFIILIVIQFVVITKGATRISEVAARFTLDGMPGKQLSVDADLNAGLINEHEARERRDKLTREADFYGAMDGASKFVRGDAIAGIIITIINIVGGLIIGYVYFGDLAKAARVFTILTIGDGLVSQIPALLISIAAGIIVSRAGAKKNLGQDFFQQIFSQPRSLFVAATFLFLMAFAGLPVPQIAVVMGICSLAAYLLIISKKQAVKREVTLKEQETPKKPEHVEALLHIDPMGLEVGYQIIKLVDTSQGGDLLHRVTMIRRQIALELGIIVPPVRIRDNMQLDPRAYQIKIRGNVVAKGTAVPDGFLAMDAGTVTGPVEGEKTKEPAFGLPAFWITEAQKQRAEALGYTVVDAVSVIATHLSEIIKSHAAEILSREDVNSLLENLKESAPVLVKEVVPEVMKPAEIQRVLQNILRERVSIRDLSAILETLGEYGAKTKDPEILTEYVRNSLARSICEQHKDKDGKLHVVTLDPKLEDRINSGIERTERGTFLTLTPQQITDIVKAITAEIEKLVSAGHLPIVLCAPQIRAQLKKILDTTKANIAVLSYNEIVSDANVQSLGTVEYKE
ncbi:MAG: flagellar biosynthesis protein FlhA [Planctomycetota bacterium]